MTDFEEYLAQERSREELLENPRQVKINSNTTEYNFSNSGEFTRFVYSQPDKIGGKSQRVEVYAHDSKSDLLVEVFSNPGHTQGVTMGHLKEIIANGTSSGIRREAPIDMSRIDFYKVHIHRP